MVAFQELELDAKLGSVLVFWVNFCGQQGAFGFDFLRIINLILIPNE